jgi:hypothetical protein
MLKRGLIVNRKGSGHLEMIISFVFFVGFIFFLFLMLKPYDTKTMPESLLRGLINSFEKETLTNLTTFFLEAEYIKFPQGLTCFSIDLSDEENIPTTSYSKSFARDELDNKVSSSLSSSGILKISKSSNTKNYFKVSISPEFEGEVLSSSCGKLENYEIGSILNIKVLSYSLLNNLKTEYFSNYEGLKEDLGVPAVYDFAITSGDLPEINMNKIVPSSAEVLARNYYFNVLKTNGDLINAGFNLKVW